MGGHVGAPGSERATEGRPGRAGPSRALGGMGGHVGAPGSERATEGRPGCAGASRALGGWGAWGAMSGPPI
jgi:hypothetical protein